MASATVFEIIEQLWHRFVQPRSNHVDLTQGQYHLDNAK